MGVWTQTKEQFMTDKPIAAGKSSYDIIDGEILWKTLDLEKGCILMDLGCGVGNYTIEAALRIGPGGIVHAVDAWAEGIEQLKGRIEKAQLHNVQPAVADVSHGIPVTPGSVDVGLLATVAHDLIRDRRFEGTMTAVTKALKPDGRLAVVEFKKIDGPPGPPIHIRLSPEELDAAVIPYGFERRRLDAVGEYHYLAQYRRS
jgi:ubiquinone/menaquinone biosynthesis C-methylase UbiE